MGVALKGESKVADRLLTEHCDVNAANNIGQTALMMAALFGRSDVVRLLIAHGANSALKDNAGNTAVGRARQQGNPEMATLLGGG
jgi:ankyrin repeat protein